MDDFTKNALRATALISALLLLGWLPTLLGKNAALPRLNFVVWEMHNSQLNADDFHALAASYYEEIESVDRISKGSENDDFQLRDDFRRFEYKPHVKHPYPAGMRITNSLGMANPEYPRRKPSHTRRIALLGDSIAVGPYGQDYEALLERKLNQSDLPPGIQQYQILNFSVPGYILLQMMDVAIETAPSFQPDVYVVQLTGQEIVGSRKHIARLVTRSVDLKYSYLRQLTTQAGVEPSDHLQRIILKLEPFFVPLTRWGLVQIRDHTAAQGARMIIILVPAVVEPAVSASDFDEIHKAADGLGIPVIDLRDTFAGVKLNDFQVVADADIHPNARGHQMIFEKLYSKLRAQPDAWAALTGTTAGQ